QQLVAGAEEEVGGAAVDVAKGRIGRPAVFEALERLDTILNIRECLAPAREAAERAQERVALGEQCRSERGLAVATQLPAPDEPPREPRMHRQPGERAAEVSQAAVVGCAEAAQQ